MNPAEHFLENFESYEQAKELYGINIAFSLWDSQMLWERDQGVVVEGGGGRTTSDRKAKKKRYELYKWKMQPDVGHEKRYWVAAELATKIRKWAALHIIASGQLQKKSDPSI